MNSEIKFTLLKFWCYIVNFVTSFKLVSWAEVRTRFMSTCFVSKAKNSFCQHSFSEQREKLVSWMNSKLKFNLLNFWCNIVDFLLSLKLVSWALVSWMVDSWAGVKSRSWRLVLWANQKTRFVSTRFVSRGKKLASWNSFCETVVSWAEMKTSFREQNSQVSWAKVLTSLLNPNHWVWDILLA